VGVSGYVWVCVGMCEFPISFCWPPLPPA